MPRDHQPSQAGLFSQGFPGSQHSSGLRLPPRWAPSPPQGSHICLEGHERVPSARLAACPAPAALCQKHRFCLKRQSGLWPAALPLSAAPVVSQNKAGQPLFRGCLYKLCTFSHADTVTEVCATQRRSRWFGSSRNTGFASLQGLLSWWMYWIDSSRAQIPPVIQSRGVLIPEVQSELS